MTRSAGSVTVGFLTRNQLKNKAPVQASLERKIKIYSKILEKVWGNNYNEKRFRMSDIL